MPPIDLAHPRPQSPMRPHRRHHPNRFTLEAFYCLTHDLDPFAPDDPVPPELFAEVNRLLLRGGRALAHAPAWQRACPFPSNMVGAVTARAAVIALLKLLLRLDPDFLQPRAAPPAG